MCYSESMAKTHTLSVRVTPATRQALAEAAATHDAAGASALARDILERWAAQTLAARTQAAIERVVVHLQEHPDGWDDEPGDFFPDAAK